MRKLILLFVSVWAIGSLYAQQTPIQPFFTEDFENTDVSQWTVVNGTQANQWHVGPAVYAGSSGKSAYISNDGGVSNAYTTYLTSIVHLYCDIEFPEGELFELSFDWKAGGESSYDYLRVCVMETNFTPVAGSFFSPSYELTSQLNFNNATQLHHRNMGRSV